MDKNWIDKKLKENETKFIIAKEYILSFIDKYITAIDDLKKKNPNNNSSLNHIKKTFNETKNELLNQKGKTHYYCTFDMSYELIFGTIHKIEKTVDELKKLSTEDEISKISNCVNIINNYCSGYNKKSYLNYRYLDSEPTNFKGDIIITDPCYIFPEDSPELTPYLEHDTIYGDWSCDTINESTKKVIGKFCADSGRVCVISLKDVLKYNPKFMETCPEYCRTIVKDFNGSIQITVKEDNGSYINSDNEKVEYVDYIVSVIGKGNINFYTIQSGL